MLYRRVALSIIVVCSILSAANGAMNLVPNNTAAVVGDDVRLICESANTASNGIDWQFGLVIIVSGCNSIDASYKTETRGDSCILIIPSVSLSQAGGYSCVYAAYDGSTYGAQVIVAEDPPIISEMSDKDLTALDVDDNAMIKCSFPNFVQVNSFTANIILSSDNSALLPQEISNPCSSSSCEVIESVISTTPLSANLYCTVHYVATQGSDAWLTKDSTIIFNQILAFAPPGDTAVSDDATAPRAGAIAGIVGLFGCIGGLALFVALATYKYRRTSLLYKEKL